MSSSKAAIVSSFVQGAPPGELADVIADIKALTADEPDLVTSLGPAFEKYNTEQFTTVKLPGGSQQVIVSSYNSLGGGRFYDVESQSSFTFSHTTQKASNVQSHVLESKHSDLMNGRWRSLYLFSPSTSSLVGSLKVDVHYYEDGNVRLLTTKPISEHVGAGGSATELVRTIAITEKKYQEELNLSFVALSEGAFKGLRRQLPISRQKIDWYKVGNYRVCSPTFSLAIADIFSFGGGVVVTDRGLADLGALCGT
ncbi:MAG: F-actin-capping protein [Geoglossum umbratile]|nr:MAG: F-actin-capping protein [Geoglossum umbratile]